MNIINKIKNMVFGGSKTTPVKSLSVKGFDGDVLPHGEVQFIDYLDYDCKKTNFDKATRLVEIKVYRKCCLSDGYNETVFNFFRTTSGALVLVYALPYETELKIGVASERYMRDKYLEATSDYGNTMNEGIKPVVTVFDKSLDLKASNLDVKPVEI